MEHSQLVQKIEKLERQLEEIKKVDKQEHNTDRIYNTKTTFGYSQLVEARGGTVVYLSGMTPWNQELKLEEDGLIDQLDHAMMNLITLLKSKELTLDHLISLRFYVAKPNYYDEMENFPGIISKHFGKKEIACTITLVGVTGLAEPGQLVELEAIAVY